MSSVVDTSISMDPTPTNAAQIGDLITYAYHFVRWGIRDFRVTIRAVTGIDKDEAGKVIGYHVEGGYWVELKHVQSVIPMRSSESGVRSAEFPLEAGQ